MTSVELLPCPRHHTSTVAVVGSPVGPYLALIHEGRSVGGHRDTAVDHFAIDLDRRPDTGWLECADVVYGTGEPELADTLLRRCPGALLITLRDAGGSCVAVSRDGARIAVVFADGRGAPSSHEHRLIASLLHSWLAADRPWGALESVVLVGTGRRCVFTIL